MTTISATGYESTGGQFPFSLDVDPPQGQNRLSVLLRILYAIPALLFAAVIGLIAGVVTIIAWFAILITGKYPAGMIAFATNSLGVSVRTYGYYYLLTDKYPPFSLEVAAYPIRLHGEGAIEGRNRLTTFFRYIMAIPHLLIVGVLGYVMSVVGFIAWLIALFTGSVPPGLHNFMAGYLRWYARTNAYLLLLTDEYPPFAMN